MTQHSHPDQVQDWFLRDWMEASSRKQADIARDLGWERGRISKLVNGRQQYSRTDVNQLADWLQIQPFELLMPPAEALALRRLREAAALIAGDDAQRGDASRAV